MESNIRAPVLLNLLNSLRKRDKMLGKPRILSLFLNLFNTINKNTITQVRSSMSCYMVQGHYLPTFGKHVFVQYIIGKYVYKSDIQTVCKTKLYKKNRMVVYAIQSVFLSLSMTCAVRSSSILFANVVHV